MMTEPFGPMSPERFAYYDQRMSCWKMFPEFLPQVNLSGLPIPWPLTGITSRGVASELPMSALRTDGTDFSLWPAALGRNSQSS